MMIPPLTDRYDFPLIAEEYFKKTNNAIEIGVFEGRLSREALLKWSGQYYMCDTFDIKREQDSQNDKELKRPIDKNGHNGLSKVLEVTDFAKERRHIIKDFSVNASSGFEDGYFDWIYIDAMHDYKNVADDLKAWWPKLRVGGLFSGDDYWSSNAGYRDYKKYSDQKTLNDADLEILSKVIIHNSGKIYPNYPDIANNYQWGTAHAIYEHAKKHRRQLNITFVNNRYQTPAWYIIK
tara:strand:+ start:3702 stop:4409 length:708 start_codon:yes stop_codon:yes gene_type:complete